MHRKKWVVGLGAVMVLIGVARVEAGIIAVVTDTTWKADSVKGHHGGTIHNVGLEWEADNVGWNTDIEFDDSAWVFAGHYYSPDSIWVAGNGLNGPSPAYFRKVFWVPTTPTLALVDLIVDDDALVYINGSLVVDDGSGSVTELFDLDVTGSMQQGMNLVAVKAHDTFGGYEALSLTLEVESAPIPEPPTFMIWTLLASVTFCIWHVGRFRKSRLPGTHHSLLGRGGGA